MSKKSQVVTRGHKESLSNLIHIQWAKHHLFPAEGSSRMHSSWLSFELLDILSPSNNGSILNNGKVQQTLSLRYDRYFKQNTSELSGMMTVEDDTHGFFPKCSFVFPHEGRSTNTNSHPFWANRKFSIYCNDRESQNWNPNSTPFQIRVYSLSKYPFMSLMISLYRKDFSVRTSLNNRLYAVTL